ncbi:MAG TPA: hypothetical protein EYP08_04100 [Pyrodictiaceae archaeon]|nr:hypothetical protein [Pyrodictiaceae archaeon]
MPHLNLAFIDCVAQAIGAVADRVREFTDMFTNSTYYPPQNEPVDRVTLYFLVMVSQDHRTGRPGRPFETTINGRKLHGADLLYYLGAKAYMEEPSLFDPERLAALSFEDARKLMCVNGRLCPPDMQRRVLLLRDLGKKLLRLYSGSAHRIIVLSRGRLLGSPEAPGLISLLTVFEAYNDPVWKKAMLLAKFLERRRILEIQDKWNKRVPVDNHVTRIALRLNLITLEKTLKYKLVRGLPFTAWEDILIRTTVREAWHNVAVKAQLDDFILDDALWSFGRKICLPTTPKCYACENHPFCENKQCIFAKLGICSWAGKSNAINEHLFMDTWWY